MHTPLSTRAGLTALNPLALLLALSLAACGDKDEKIDTGAITGVDDDGDGFSADDGDCNDEDSAVSPSAEEICDGIDNNCDGVIDEGVTDPFYADTDNDGFGNDGSTVDACEPPSGYAAVGGDCDDADDSAYPGAPEYCDGIDNDCDGQVDEDGTSTYYADADGDGFGDPDSATTACAAPKGYVENAGDCDDSTAYANPDATEYCDQIDNDCDGETDEDDAADATTWYADTDFDTYGNPFDNVTSCESPAGYVADATDCDDTETSTNPGADEVCDGDDNDCDGTVDEDDAINASTWYEDYDGDNFGNAGSTQQACSQPAGYVSDSTDCRDNNSAINPDADEVCDNQDNDCDGTVDEDDATDAATWYADADSDGYGDSSSTALACDAPSGYIADDTDCDDGESTTNPGASEYCDEVDNDCDGDIDEGALDATTFYADTDGDGYGAPGVTIDDCDLPSGYSTDSTDCDDGESTTNPGADEYCDSVDNDCDGHVDEDSAVDAQYLADDSDGDGFGDPGTTDLKCEGSDNEYDCDDSDASEPQVVDAAYGSSTGTGSLTSPHDAIQDGIDSASQCVVVYGGTYNENIDFNGYGLIVSGVEGPDNTIISGGGSGPVVTFSSGEAADSELTGFTLTEGSGFEETTSVEVTDPSDSTGSTTYFEYYTTYCGGGIFIDGASPTLHNLVLLDNDLSVPADSTDASNNEYYYYSYGGGLCVRSASVGASNLSILENYADDGGGVFVDSASSFALSQSIVMDNSAEGGGGFEIDGGSLDLNNVLLAWNTADEEGGGVLVIDGTLTATNVTHGGDDAPTGGGIYLAGDASYSTGTVINSIIYGAATGAGVLLDAGSSFTGEYNNVYGNAGDEYSGVTDPTGTDGNISSDPLFTSVSDDGSYENDDWTLSSSSPSIDAGDPDSAYDDADGTTNDQGAWGGPGGVW